MAAQLAIVLFAIACRVPLAQHFIWLGKDGPRYLEALDPSLPYSVPLPGNVGFVLCARMLWALGVDGVVAYESLTIAAAALGGLGFLLLAEKFFDRALAFCLALLLLTNAVVWFHATPITSYPCWFAVLPWMAWAAVRLREAPSSCRLWQLLALWSAGILLRPDIGLFGSGLALWGMAGFCGKQLGRWLRAFAVVAVVAVATVALTAIEVGGLAQTLAGILRKYVYIEEFGWRRGDWVEGIPRNVVKLGLFMGWGCHLGLVLAGVAIWRYRRSPPPPARLALVWLAPATIFSLLTFVSTAGFVLLLAPGVCILVGLALPEKWGGVARIGAVVLLSALSIAQFLATSILPHRDTRAVVLNVSLLRYSAAGAMSCYNYNLNEFGVDNGWRAAARHVIRPSPVTTFPERWCF